MQNLTTSHCINEFHTQPKFYKFNYKNERKTISNSKEGINIQLTSMKHTSIHILREASQILYFISKFRTLLPFDYNYSALPHNFLKTGIMGIRKYLTFTQVKKALYGHSYFKTNYYHIHEKPPASYDQSTVTRWTDISYQGFSIGIQSPVTLSSPPPG